MKWIPVLLLTLVFFFACRHRDAREPSVTEDTLPAEGVFAWRSTLNDSTGNLEMKRVEGLGPDSLDAASVTLYLNDRNPRILLNWQRQSNDTAYLKIDDATVLTQQMGTTGAMMYLASVVYNITELPGVRFVTLDFEEGDHAVPGTYTRASFKDE